MPLTTRLRRLSMLVGACLAPACGTGTPADPDFVISAQASWSWSAAQPDALGYTVSVTLAQRMFGAPCREASASTRLTVNGVDVPLTRFSDSGCLTGQFSSPPVLGDLSLTARLEEDGHPDAEVVFDRLMPGTAATLQSPADGQVHAGDDVLIVPPPELPSSLTGRVAFYPLDDVDWLPEGIAPEHGPERRLDGLHQAAPAFTGRALLIVEGWPSYLLPDVTCPGFASCTERREHTLGPFMLTGVP